VALKATVQVDAFCRGSGPIKRKKLDENLTNSPPKAKSPKKLSAKTMRKLALGAFASATTMWIIAGFWHNDLGPKMLGGEGEQLSIQALSLTFVVYLIVALVIARTFMILPEHRRTIPAGMRIGAYAGLLWAVPHSLLGAAGAGDPLGPVALDALGHLLEEGLGGIVFGAAYLIGNGQNTDS
jgi:hypothetical protein